MAAGDSCATFFNRVRDFAYLLAASAAKSCRKEAVIKSAASVASAKGGCASSRLDHGLKFHEKRGGCASSRLISGFSDCEHQLPGMYMGKHRQWLQLVGQWRRHGRGNVAI